MKAIFLFIGALMINVSMSGQDITGQWNGLLKVQNIQLRLVFHISATDDGLEATMDSPDQGAKDIQVTTISFENSILNFEITPLGVKYTGTLKNEGIIVGTFNQAGQSFPLDLSKETVEKEKIIRPQEPTGPVNYHSEEVKFTNAGADVTLAGTLTLPTENGKHPVVVLITGSGPQNRDEEILGHKPFLIIADHLTKNGIGVLRYDDRGVGESTGDFGAANSLDFASDVQSAVDYLKTRKEINSKYIGLIGHSEGGLIAPIVAAESEDVAFIVLLAGPGIDGYQIIMRQSELIGRASGVEEEELQSQINITKGALKIVIEHDDDDESMRSTLSAYFKKVFSEDPDFEVPDGMTEDQVIDNQVVSLASPWMKFFLKYDPAINLRKVKCPVLAINGEKDLQVPPKVNLEAIENYLKEGGNTRYTIKELPGLNHLFQKSDSGVPSEYAQIEETISPIALAEITTWIKQQIE